MRAGGAHLDDARNEGREAVTSDHYDIAIVGLGAMGSAAAYHCAARGARVVGFDRFTPPHGFGSSHGETRIIREAYFEDPRYVPLVQRAYALWRELERGWGRVLLTETGGLMIGPPSGTVVRGAVRSAEEHGLRYERLEAAEIRRRFPALGPRHDMVGIWEPRAGVLFPEECIRAHLAFAREAGADLRFDTAIESWRADGDEVEIRTAERVFRANRMILAANAWLPRLALEAALPIQVSRQPLFWFEPRAHAERFEPERLPISIWEPEPDRFFYAFPAFGGQVKVAIHGEGAEVDPDQVDRTVHESEIETIRGRLATAMPDANGAFARAAVCMYANTPDGHFIIDRLPGHENVLLVSACSGHGFKFSSAIGEIAADVMIDGKVREELALFALRDRVRS